MSEDELERWEKMLEQDMARFNQVAQRHFAFHRKMLTNYFSTSLLVYLSGLVTGAAMMKNFLTF